MRATFRHVPVIMAVAIGAVALGPVVAGLEKPPVPGVDDRTIGHVLDRLGFGARPGDVDRVRAMGLTAYIDQQLHPERIEDAALTARLATFDTLSMSTQDLAQEYFLPAIQLRRQAQRTAGAAPPENAVPGGVANQNDSMTAGTQSDGPARVAVSPELRQARTDEQQVLGQLMQAKMLRATLSNRQLEEVLDDFWFNHFNVFIGKGQVRLYLPEYERDVIRPHVLGHFRDLLGAVAHSPAMLFFLDNWQSSAPGTGPVVPASVQARLNNPRLRPAQRALILQRLQAMQAKGGAKRQTRGINENYAREIMELHTLGVDGGYTQSDVQELARILTGWTIDRPQQGGQFVFRPEMHDTGTKTFLGVTFTSDGEHEGERALDLLAKNPATAHHISYELAQRFVADEPPAALVDRAAHTFLTTNGDIREVVRTIVTSPEFFAPDAYRAKVKTPLEFVVSAVRATGATVTSAQPLVVAMRNLGMPLYGCQPPTGYSMTADAWVNTGALLGRMNFAVQLLRGGRIQPDSPARGGGAGARAALAGGAGGRGVGRGRAAGTAAPLAVDVTAIAPDMSDGTRARVVDLLLQGQVSDATRATLARAETPQNLVALALGSPEFQRR